MADKKYKIKFKMSDGTDESVEFTVPQGEKGDVGPAGVYVGTEAPTDGETVWIDTDEQPDEDEGGSALIDVVATPGQVIAVEAVDAYSKPTKFKAVDLPKVTTPDLSANEGEDGYIKGRTHYIDEKGIVHKLPNKFIDADWMATSEEGGGKVVFIPEQTVSGSMWSDLKADLVEGDSYAVEVNGVLYKCVCLNDGDGTLYLGNGTLLGATGGNGEPFAIAWMGGAATSGIFYNDGTLAEPIGIKVTDWQDTVYNKLPEEFLPDNVVKGEGGKVRWDDVSGKPFVEDTGKLLLSKTVTFATDAAATNGSRVMNAGFSLVKGTEYWLDVNGDMIKCRCENISGTLELHDAAGHKWLSQVMTFTYIHGQAAGTYAYKLYEMAENIVLDPQYIPSNIARKSDIPNVSGIVKSVNGNAPDENGNVTVKIPESTGGGVDVTAEVGQTIVVEEVDANGKPTKWKAADYQPRTHWSEYIETVLVDNKTCSGDGSTLLDFLLVEGQSYHIVFNGTEYDEVARAEDVDGITLVLLGNGIFGTSGEDTGEPYGFQSLDGVGTAPLSVDGSDLTLTLSTTQEVVAKLPTKYMPDEVANYAPYYILGAIGSDGSNALVVINVATLEALIDAKRQVIVRVQYGDSDRIIYAPLVYHKIANDNSYGRVVYFSAFFGEGTVTLVCVPQEDGTYAVTGRLTTG